LSTDGDETDDESHTVVGRRGSISISVSETRNSGGETNWKPPRAPSPQPPVSSSDGFKANHSSGTLSRRTFTRSRSPAPRSLGKNGLMPQPPLASPTGFLRPRGPAIFVLPGTLSLTLSSWMVPWHYRFRIDARHAAEGVILMFALACASQKLRSSPSALLPSDDGLPIGTLCFSVECTPCQSCTRQNSMQSFLPASHSWSGITLTSHEYRLCRVQPTRLEPTPRLLPVCKRHAFLVVLRQMPARLFPKTEYMYG